MPELVVETQAGRVRVITLNRPEVRNALNGALLRAAAAALTAADDDPGVDAVVLTGSDPAFCAGLDLGELGSDAAALVGVGDDPATSPFAALARMRTPVVGAVNGPCVTGGLELALACDFLVASERATFADTHARVGVMPGGGMSVALPAAVGLRLAKEMSFTGRFLGAAEALRAGLVNRVVPHGELLGVAVAIAEEIAGNDTAAVRALKRLYDENARGSVDEAWARERDRFRTWRIDPASVAARRATVVERGRRQQR
jgi:enoyl-CoA hydratase